MAGKRPVVAILYDFDRTLCTKDMQEYQFIPSVGMEPADFWGLANSYAEEEHMDKILSYMYIMIKKSHECGIPLTTAVNYTSKTQFVYRINKGVLDVSNDKDLNRSTPDNKRRVPFSNMLYIGDGLSDVPCMKMVKAYGGYSIAVHNNEPRQLEGVSDLLYHNRVDFAFAADYSENSELDITVKDIIRRIAIDSTLRDEHSKQKRRSKCCCADI